MAEWKKGVLREVGGERSYRKHLADYHGKKNGASNTRCAERDIPGAGTRCSAQSTKERDIRGRQRETIQETPGHSSQRSMDVLRRKKGAAVVDGNKQENL